MSAVLQDVSPEIFGRLLGAAEIGLRYMRTMVEKAVFPDGVSRTDVLSDIGIAERALYEAQYPTDAEKVHAHLQELMRARGETDPLVMALSAVLDVAIEPREAA
jgi:uncharacterized protein YeaC (DUF1315 family)